MNESIQRPRNASSLSEQELFFDPRLYSKEIEGLVLEDRVMGTEELKHFGVMVSKHREELRCYGTDYDAALADSTGINVHKISSLTQRSTHGYFSATRGLSRYKFGYMDEELLPGQRRKRDGKKKLSVNDQIAIAHKVIVD